MHFCQYFVLKKKILNQIRAFRVRVGKSNERALGVTTTQCSNTTRESKTLHFHPKLECIMSMNQVSYIFIM